MKTPCNVMVMRAFRGKVSLQSGNIEQDRYKLSLFTAEKSRKMNRGKLEICAEGSPEDYCMTAISPQLLAHAPDLLLT